MLIVGTFATLISRGFEVDIDDFAQALFESLEESLDDLQAPRVRHFLGLLRSTTAAE
jgi:hypothetical protein